ncbi:MAG: Gfo/Idh/MocA family oxidoreductase [Lentisphaerae bacterium]|jgi:predicted dehydrogenase|nr:Gfo/Idh/MocA family oxidoreductase [Lentisphaerota bacterium]MBT4817238.1 Gfo/Idh/MocA family oxidoreductase [Lentisphaerota bacterium]MBT5608321.1 Gfo/Idh/MocA family oxidoreductase [Lentisphaerota bacterium]MBT7057484.1 Gfo/Idh/MocA family oxidoreductase [Lentisphaerota bacterium]MBT7844478.1 Gfo/Idh/MocA family oxidoreductase [Lentisphaerota bacterium]
MPKANDTVNVAIVGAGGMGRGVARCLMPFADVRIIAVADPAGAYEDDFFYKKPVGRLPLKAEIETHYGATLPGFTCTAYKDFRVMLEREPEIDAIVCATPDHLHAYVSVTAMRMGKHVYCEKPLAHNIWEARLMARVAEEMGVATQMGNLGHARDGMRDTCEWLWDGAIGVVREVHAWAGATRWNKGMIAPPVDAPPVPEDLDWDLWLGPREPRPYHPAYFPVRWRDFWTFGLGPIGDFVCHDLDAACWALDLQDPLTVEAYHAGRPHPEMTAHGEICYYEYGQRGNRPPVAVTWYDGGLRPRTPADWPGDEPLPGRGVLFVGDKGSMLCAGTVGAPPRLYPDALMEAYTPPPESLPRSPGHHREWIDAIKGGPATGSHFGYAAKLTELALLGVLALRLGKKVIWNAAEMRVENAPEADAIIRTAYRAGWELDAQ